MSVTAKLRIATRASDLARWQANHVGSLLMATNANLSYELVAVSTEGDRRLDIPLAEIGGKGVFATEVQAAILDGRADFAVHSAKDLPAVTVAGLHLAAVPERGDPRDAIVGTPLGELPEGASVATGSPRRRALLLADRADLRLEELRGNMATRLAKAKHFDAIVVAAAALSRLGLDSQITEFLDPLDFVPQVGQGCLAVECRAGDSRLIETLERIDHDETHRRLDAERSYLAELGGDCSLPAGAFASVDSAGTLTLHAVLASSVGGTLVRGVLSERQSETPGIDLARQLRHELEQE